MALAPIEKGREIAEREREELATGKPRPPLLTHGLQRAAARALAIFMILMLALTLLSRAADGVTVAKVQAEAAKSGVLTQRMTVGGSIEAQGDLELTLPAGLRVTRVAVSEGQAVQPGDVLLELDADALARTLEKLESDAALLDLKIENAAQGRTGAGSDAVSNAQAALESANQTLLNAQADYDRQVQRRETAEGRTTEDEARALEEYDAAVQVLERASAKAAEAAIKVATDAAEAAKEALEETETSAKEAKTAAKDAFDGAGVAQSNANSSYEVATGTYERTRAALTEAQRLYDEAVQSGDPVALAAALAALNQAQSAFDSAQNSLNGLYDQSAAADRSVQRAKDAMKATEEKWDAAVKKAEEKLTEAERAVSKAEAQTDWSEEAAVISAQSALDGAERALQSARRGTEDAATATEDALLAAQRAVESAQSGVAAAQRTLDQANAAASREQVGDQNTLRQSEIERLGYVAERRELQRKLDELRAVSDAGGVLTAPIAGTVLARMEETGITQEGQRVALLSRSDRGFEFVGRVGQEEAEKLSPGDKASLSYTREGKKQETEATILSIGAPNEKGEVEIRAALPEGNWPAGTTASLEVSKRSEQYGTTLPLGALRSDGGDTFVLVLREKSTVMGIEQTVEKVPVKTLEQDSERVALQEGALAYGEQVVVSANKPVSQGDRVRLEAEK